MDMSHPNIVQTLMYAIQRDAVSHSHCHCQRSPLLLLLLLLPPLLLLLMASPAFGH